MRWKLANGGVVTSPKQPTYKDFDQIICSSCDANQYQYTYMEIYIVNPSTFTKRKSYNGELYLMATPVARRNKHRPYRGKTINCIHLSALHSGYNLIELYEDDMDGWIRDNVNLRNRGPSGNPWDPESHTATMRRTILADLVLGENGEKQHGYIYRGKLFYGYNDDYDRDEYVRDKVIVSIWRWNGRHGGRKHMRRIASSEPVDTYLTYLEI